MNNTLKTCAKCRQIKSTSAFSKGTCKDGLKSWCRACMAAWARQNYKTDKGKAAHKQAHAKWYQTKIAEPRKTRLGIEIAETLGLTKTEDNKYLIARGIKNARELYSLVQQIMRNQTV